MTPTPKEGPSTLSDARMMARSLAWFMNRTPANEKCPYCYQLKSGPHNGACVLIKVADISDEALERDEKERANTKRYREALEKLRAWALKSGAGYVGATAHNALLEPPKEKP